MAKPKKSTKGAAAAAALSAEQIQAMSLEQLQAVLANLTAENAQLKTAIVKAEKAVKKEFATMEVEADKKNGIEGGTYQFPFHSFTWDDGRVIKVEELLAEAEGKDKEKAEAAEAILAQLVARKSVYPKK